MELLTDARKRAGPGAPSVLAVGNFDGVHRGHLGVLSRARELAERLDVRFGAVVFDPHPARWFRPEGAALPAITTPSERRLLLERAGADLLVEQTFDEAFAELSPEEFLDGFLRARLRARGVVVGSDFSFGKGRAGDGERLRAWGARSGVEVLTLDAIERGGERISSTRVRALLQEGRVSEAEDLLSRPFSYSGIVERGDARGARIGFPTVNLRIPVGKLVVPYGVYATRLRVAGQEFPSVTNVGVRPTFGGDAVPRIETHALDAKLDVRGLRAEVLLIERIRPERRFSGAEELVARIREDVQAARAFLIR